MRRVRLGPCPAVLKGPESLGGRETANAIAIYSDPARAEDSFEFKLYKHDEVKHALNTCFHFKCAYCESYFGHVQPVDIEHYRPKSGVVIATKLAKPGYYWLAAAWGNLLPSCIDCNRKRGQDFSDATSGLSGKANDFPLQLEITRAKKPGDERGERRLLLHPALDRPEKHLSFSDDGNIAPRADRRGRESAKGSESIRVYGLRRTGLVQERKRHARYIATALVRYERLVRIYGRTGDAETRELIRDEVAFLKSQLDPEQPYSEMSRQIIEPVLQRTTP